MTAKRYELERKKVSNCSLYEITNMTFDYVELIVKWFDSRESVSRWSGIEFSYPMTFTSFVKDASINSIPTKVLFFDGELCSFIQYRDLWSRNHLMRIIVAPRMRNNGLGKATVLQTSKTIDNNCDFSLFVDTQNIPAYQCYKKLNFKEKKPLEAANLPSNATYLVASKCHLTRLYETFFS